MEDRGLIHEKLDIKILILYILQRLPAPVKREALAELVLCDAGITYFDFAQCLVELIDTDHATETAEGVCITEKGRENGSAIESSIPYTVRRRAEGPTELLARKMRRFSMIQASHFVRYDGNVPVTLALGDGVGEILEMRLLAPNEETAQKMEDAFRTRAEAIYTGLITMLTEEK